MNLSQASTTENATECKHVFYKSSSLQHSTSDSFYGLLVAAAVLSLAACPFTILLNALVIGAVKTKRRLQTHPNILLACMALTDLISGLVVQPLYITVTIFLLTGEDFRAFCDINLAFSISFFQTFWTSMVHLVLISGERYFAIKRVFSHASFVTKPRLMVASAMAWIAAALLFVIFTQSANFVMVLIATIISSSIVLHGLVYSEAHRHEKQILSQQVSMEARAKFKREKKALKLTTLIIVAICLCCVLPVTVRYITWNAFREHFSPEVKTFVRQLTFVLSILNSLVNPAIYTVRKREFRIAFLELLLRKSFQDAEETERRLFRFRSNAVNPENE